MRVDLEKYSAVLLDLDGTLCQEEHALPGAAELLKRLEARGKKFACLSNNTKSPAEMTARLGRMGMKVTPEHIYTAGAAAVDYCVERFGKGARVYNLCGPGVDEQCAEAGCTLVKDRGEACDAIVVGVPLSSYAAQERQRTAVVLAKKGAVLVGTSNDRLYPTPEGIAIGSGALTMMLAYASGTEAVFTGKPQKLFFEELCHKLNVEPAKCVLVGDNIESDLKGAKGAGMDCIMTLTGICTRGDLEKLAERERPEYVIKDLTELL